MDNLFQNNF